MKKLFLTLFLILSLPGTVFSASQGPNSATTLANDDTVGNIEWTNPGNAQTADSTNATVAEAYNSYYLKVTGFGFSLPGGSYKVSGIKVDVLKSALDTLGQDYSVRLLRGGAILGDDKATATAWPDESVPAYVSYGGATDTWGLAWTVDDINYSGFGVVFAGTCLPDGILYVDHIRITVWYDAIPPTSFIF